MKATIRLSYTEVAKESIMVWRSFRLGKRKKVKESSRRHVFGKDIDLPEDKIGVDIQIQMPPFAAARTVKAKIYDEQGGFALWVEDVSHKARLGMESFSEEELKNEQIVSMGDLEKTGWKLIEREVK